MIANNKQVLIEDHLHELENLEKSSKNSFSPDRTLIPTTSGLYLIHSHDKLLYVGETANLQRRLLGDHRSGNIKGSAFRKSLQRHEKLNSEEEISKYIMGNCSFQFIEIEDKLRRKRLEHFAIAVLEPILNDLVES